MQILLKLGLVMTAFGTAAQAQSTDSTVRTTTMLQVQVTTATRTSQAVGQLPVNIAVLGPVALSTTASKSVPDLLRVIPGFSTRDYQSALTMHPSRSAPAIRGLGGGTSASRMLVLMDGVPINEPFAGWVFWSRVPVELVRQVELIRGGGAGVWGDRALGGVINIVTEQPKRSHATLSVAGGSMNTVRTNFTGSTRVGTLGLSVSADYAETGGFINVPASIRGPIDAPVDSRSVVGFVRGVWDVTPMLQLNASGSYLDDYRNGGTRQRKNSTAVKDARAGLRYLTAGGSVLTANAYANASVFDMFNTTEAADRRSEVPSLNQFDVPANAQGVQVQWARAFGRHQIAAGVDATWIDGEVNEDQAFQVNQFTRRRHVSGEQRAHGIYLQDAFSVNDRLQLLGSVRSDRFRFPDAMRRERNIQTGATIVDSTYAATSGGHTSYNVGLRLQATSALGLRGSVYSSYRAPTMNELFKPAREAGNTIIESNATLGPETLNGAEVGADLRLGSRVMTRLTTFWNQVDNSIVDRTIGRTTTAGRTIAPCGFVSANGTCRQRDYFDEVVVHGIESEVEMRASESWTVAASHVWNPTRVSESTRDPAMVGRRVRSAPLNSGTASVTYASVRPLGGNVMVRYIGRRYDDDLNSLPLAPFAVLDARVNYRLPRMAQVYVSAENLLNRTYLVTLTAAGLMRTGNPRLIEGGIRASW